MKTDNILTAAVPVSLALLFAAGAASGDELTLMVETDLSALGYATGPVDGEETMETVIAISKFQAENQLEVTGEVTPQLAGILSARASGAAPAPAAAPAAAAAPDPAALEAARQACLQKKMADAQAAQQKKRGFGRLMSAVTRTATRQGNYDIAQTASDVYDANATAEDLAAAARDLGLTEDDVAACQNPG